MRSYRSRRREGARSEGRDLVVWSQGRRSVVLHSLRCHRCRQVLQSDLRSLRRWAANAKESKAAGGLGVPHISRTRVCPMVSHRGRRGSNRPLSC
jgi:hypothetical protein